MNFLFITIVLLPHIIKNEYALYKIQLLNKNYKV